MKEIKGKDFNIFPLSPSVLYEAPLLRGKSIPDWALMDCIIIDSFRIFVLKVKDWLTQIGCLDYLRLGYAAS